MVCKTIQKINADQGEDSCRGWLPEYFSDLQFYIRTPRLF